MAAGSDPVGKRKERRITELVRILRDAEQELQSLTGGQVDSVSDPAGGTHLLLSSAQEQLRGSEIAQRLATETQIAILNALPAHIALLDPSGVILVVNDAWQRFASANVLQSRDFCIGQNYLAVCDEAHGVCSSEAFDVARGIRDVLSGAREIFSLEYPCHSPDQKRWFRLMVTPLASGPGEGAVVMHVNVTERRQMEELLRQNEERYRLMIEGSGRVLFYTHDRSHMFEYLSPSCSTVLGYEAQELVGKPYDLLVIPDDPINADARALTGQAMQDGQPCPPYLAAVRHKDGRRVILEMLESPLLSDGRVTGIQGFARDITDALEAQRVLAEFEARFRGVFSQTRVGMVIASSDGRIVRGNRRFAEIIGYSEEEIVGLSCVAATHPDDRAHEAEIVAQILAGGTDGETWEKRYLRKDGTAAWCTLSLSLFRTAGSDERQFIGVIEDISEKKLAEEALLQGQRLLRIAGTAAKLGGWVLELNSMRLHWSDEVCAIHETPAGFVPTLEEAMGFYPPQYRDQVEAAVAEAAREGTPFRFEHELITRTGKRIWVLAIGEAVRDTRGSIVRLQGALQDISDRKQAEATLAEHQRRFRVMADSFPFIIWTADQEGQVDYANRRMIDYTSANPGDPPATRWQQFVHPEDLAACLESWDAAVAMGKPYSLEYRLRQGATGEYRWFHIRAEPVWDNKGEIYKWYGTAIDIHATKTLEKQSADLAKRYSDTLESITDGLFVLDQEWCFSFLNTQAEKILQRPTNTLLGKNVWDEFPHAAERSFKEHYEKAVREHTSVHFQEYYPPPLDGWYDVSAYPGEEGLAVYFRDITQEHASRAQLHLLQTAVARLNDIVLITEATSLDDPGPRIVFVNDAFVRRTGYSLEEVIGKTPRILQGPKTQRDELDRIRSALVKWQPVRAQLINYTKSGEEFWLELDIVPLADATGWFTHWVAVERDITERRNLEDQLRQSQRLESVGQLTGGLAHDFNNLLTVIMGNGELLAEQLAADTRSRGLAEMITGAAQRGAELTQRLLAFARKQPLSPKAVGINDLVAGMEPLLRRTLGEHIEIEFAIGAGLWLALVDPAQLESALLNLCLNSRDAMPGGGRLTIEAGNMRLDRDYADQHADVQPGQYVMVAVTDSGAGIAPEHLVRVFEPFYTTKEKGKGTGLGLAMVYGFIKQSGGHVRIYSEPGEGTTVKLYLPRAMSEQAGMMEWPERVQPAGGSETVLLVEDDEMVRQYAHDQLVSLGYTVIQAANGLQGLQIIKAREDIDLLFTDVVMPGGMSGRVLADEAKKLRPQLKVLYTSGYTENAIVHHGRLDSGFLLLAKPYRRTELAQIVREAIEEQRESE